MRHRRHSPPLGRRLADVACSSGSRSSTEISSCARPRLPAPPAPAAARAEARRRGVLERLEFVDGDFVSRSASIDAADIVTLDRVVCCYPDVESLVRLSSSRARSAYGLVLPRDRLILRVGLRLLNIWFR